MTTSFEKVNRKEIKKILLQLKLRKYWKLFDEIIEVIQEGNQIDRILD